MLCIFDNIKNKLYDREIREIYSNREKIFFTYS